MNRKGRLIIPARWLVAAAVIGAAGLSPVLGAGANKCDDDFLFANQLLEQNPPDYADAVAQYKEILQSCPTFDKADLVDQNLAYAYLNMKPANTDAAIGVLAEAVQRFPNSTHLTDLQVALGTAYLHKADAMNRTDAAAARPVYQNAIRTLQSASQKVTDPKVKGQILFAVGNAQFNTGDFAGSSSTYGSLLALNPVPEVAAPAYYNLGNAELNLAAAAPEGSGTRTQAFGAAATAFSSLINRYKNDANVPDATLQLAKVEYQQKNYDQAIALFRQLAETGKGATRAEALNGEANSLVALKRYNEAVPLLQRYVQENPGSVDADKDENQIGYILRSQLKDLPGALKAYRAAAASKDPKTAQFAQRGEIAVAIDYVKGKDYRSAIPIYQALQTSTDPGVREDASYGMAIAMVNTNDPNARQALQNYMTAFPNSAGFANAAYQLGVIQYAANDFAGAAATFARAGAAPIPSTATPEDSKEAQDIKREALYWAGQSYSKANRSDQAVTYWKQELAADPNYTSEFTADALVGLGQYYSAQNQDTQANTYFQSALTRFPNSSATSDALLALGGSAAKAGQWDKAIGFYTQIARSQPNTDAGATAQFNLGLAELKRTPPQTTAALQAFEAYLAKNPNGKLADRANLYVAEAYELSGGADAATNRTRAIAAYRQAMANTKDSEVAAHAAWKVGALEGQMGQSDAAVRDLDAAIAKYPDAKDLDHMYFEKGLIYQESKQNAPALTAFQSYLAKYPQGRDAQAAHFNVAILEYNAAAALHDKIAATTDNAAAAQLAAQAKSDYQKAAADFEASVAGKPEGVPLEQAYYYMGWAYANSDQPARAIPAFKTLMTNYPNSQNATTAGARIGILEASANPDEAIPYLKKYLATATDAQAVDANLALGIAYQTKGDNENALTYLNKVTDATHDEPAAEATYYKGKVYEREGNKEQARLAYLRVVHFYGLATTWVTKAQAELTRLNGGAAPA